MHVRLEVLEARRLLQHGEALVFDERVGRDVDTGAAVLQGREGGQVRAVLWLLAFGIEPNAQLNGSRDLFTDSVNVLIPPDFRSGEQQLAGVRAIHVALFT